MVNFTPANLQRAGEGALFPKNSKLMNELAGAVLKENKNEVKYDLLDDETGAVTGTLSDFETAYALETLNKEFDSSYVPSIHKSNNGNSYAYDTDRDGKWDTHVLFNDNGELVNHTSYGQEATLDIYYNYLSAFFVNPSERYDALVFIIVAYPVKP